MRGRGAIRAAAAVAVAVGVAAPLSRRRLRLRPPVVLGLAAAAPFGLCVLVPRSARRDLAVCALQMWAYVAAYKIPNDDPAVLERRVRVRYPIVVDRVIGLGTLPTVRIQRRLPPPGNELTRLGQVLVWAHWLWFLVPHVTLAYVFVRQRAGFGRAAVLTYANFDLGAVVYWALPTAPPWYAAQQGALPDGEHPAVRRMMVEHGERFWRARWQRLYSVFGGNPLAAMPSLHFATSVMSAHLLGEVGGLEAAAGWGYAAVLGLALVYLGEHYVVDLIAGLALTESLRRAEPPATPALTWVAARVAVLERAARA